MCSTSSTRSSCSTDSHSARSSLGGADRECGGDRRTVPEGEGDRSPFGDGGEMLALLASEVGGNRDGPYHRASLVVRDVIADVDLDRGELPALASRVHAQRHRRARDQRTGEQSEGRRSGVATTGGSGFVGNHLVPSGPNVNAVGRCRRAGRADGAGDVTDGSHAIGSFAVGAGRSSGCHAHAGISGGSGRCRTSTAGTP